MTFEGVDPDSPAVKAALASGHAYYLAPPSHPRDTIFLQIEAERLKQEKEDQLDWGHELDTAACLALDGITDPQELRKVLVEAASYAIGWIEELDAA